MKDIADQEGRSSANTAATAAARCARKPQSAQLCHACLFAYALPHHAGYPRGHTNRGPRCMRCQMNRVLAVSLTMCLASCSDDSWSTAPSSVRASVTSPTPNSPYRSKSVVGTFDFIFSAHPSCVQLPVDVRRRSYVTTIPGGV